MTGIGFAARWRRGLAGLIVGTVLVGCSSDRRVEPVVICNTRLGPITIAVAPALNLSGSAAFDPSRFADLMASELSYADGVSVIPVSRVLGVLSVQSKAGVESPAHALELTGLLGADAMLVFAVTEYDPYDPPSIGISAQLYGEWSGASGRSLDPLVLSRQTSLVAANEPTNNNRLLAQTQRVYDASHDSVVADIREFARMRRGDGSAYGWRKYVVSQQHFIRYCCHATIRALLARKDEPAHSKDDQDG